MRRPCTFRFTLTLLILSSLLLAEYSGAQPVERRRMGDLGLLLSAGVLNGARVGVTSFVADRLSAEASIGLVRIKLLEAGDEVKHTAGYSASFAASWYTHRDDPVSPLLFIQGSWVNADGARIDQQRWIACAGIGTEYSPLPALAVFMRFGPAMQTIRTRGNSESEFTMQFDAGVNLFF
jgi:hypothetical protein